MKNVSGDNVPINSKRKGNTNERALCKLFSTRFGLPFSRVPTSGARGKQVQLSAEVAEIMAGDIVCPPDFRFCIECKSHNVNIDFFESSRLWDGFLDQVEEDARNVDKIPMLCWKRPRKSWLVCIPHASGHCYNIDYYLYLLPYYMIYNGWIICKLEDLLAIEARGFWFNERA